MARQLRGINQAKLSSLAGITQGHLSKIENGLSDVSGEVLQCLAKALDFPISFFSQPDKIFGLPLSIHSMMHRKKASVGQKALDRIHAEINVRLMHLRRLLKATEITPKLPIPRFDVDDYNGDVEKIADLVRKTWLIPPGPLGNLVEYLEQAGCVVIFCDFSEVAIDGISFFAPDCPPCVFINRFQPADRMRFTLAHELGHLIMHRLPTAEMEDQANSFASAFLMPSRDIRKNLSGKVTLPRLAMLKPQWRVSMQALLMRAKSIGAITPRQSQYLWQQINKHGFRFQEPPELDFPYDEPIIIPTILKFHIENLKYSVTELAKILHIEEADFRKMYHFPTNQRGSYLRLIL